MPKIIIDFIYFCSIPFPLLYLYLILFCVSAKRYCIWKLCQCNCQHTPLHFGCWCRALCLYAWKLFDITCTYYNQMRVFIAKDSYLIQGIRTWHIDFIKKIHHNRSNHTLVACFPPYTQEHWRMYFGWLHRMEHLAFAHCEEQQKVYYKLGRWNVFQRNSYHFLQILP